MEIKVEKILHQHQFDALEAIRATKSDKVRVVIPTGGGKTLIESLVIRDRLNTKRGGKIHLVLAPRIVLVNQLIAEYRNEIGQDYLAIAFHSGSLETDYEKIQWQETSTTNIDVVIKHIDRSSRMKKDLVVFSTYASMHKLMGIRFNTLIADESQYCVTEGFFEPIRDITADMKLFFTATERHTRHTNGRGLNNEEVFGEKIFQVSPRTLADRGIIVLPRLHIMRADSKDTTKTVVDEVIHLAKAQSSLNGNTGMPVTKVLFAMDGTTDVEAVATKHAKISAEMPGYDIFTITSRCGAKINGALYTRNEWFKRLRESDNALIFHFDILAEGVDIDGITGVAILRNMKQSKLLQTIGRAVRTYKANPSLKKHCWVSVTSINNDEESKQFVTDIIMQMRDGGFDIGAEMMDFTGLDGRGIKDEDGLDDAYGSKRSTLAQFILDNVKHEAELEELNYMSDEEMKLEIF